MRKYLPINHFTDLSYSQWNKRKLNAVIAFSYSSIEEEWDENSSDITITIVICENTQIPICVTFPPAESSTLGIVRINIRFSECKRKMPESLTYYQQLFLFKMKQHVLKDEALFTKRSVRWQCYRGDVQCILSWDCRIYLTLMYFLCFTFTIIVFY